MKLRVLIYGYATGVFSSRGIACKLEEDVASRVLGAGNFRSHRTICEFRRRHLPDWRPAPVEDEKTVVRRVEQAKAEQLSRPAHKPPPDHRWRRPFKLEATGVAAG